LLNDEHELGSQALRRLDECVFHAFTKGDFDPFLDLCDPNTVVGTIHHQLVDPASTFAQPSPLHALLLAASLFLPQLFSRSAADGETILMAAALHARLDLVHLFLDVGAFPWTKTLGRHSPPMNAIAFAQVSPSLLRMLCANSHIFSPDESSFANSGITVGTNHRTAAIAHARCRFKWLRCRPLPAVQASPYLSCYRP
jgi:hypothetical protein